MFNPQGNDNLPQMTFLIGMGRSGTTLLTNMLNSNPNIVSSPENEFMLFAYQSFATKDFTSESVVDSFLSLFEFEYNKVTSIWTPSPELRLDIKNLKNKNFANVCKLVYLNYPLANKSKSQVTCLVDKNPVYSLYLDKIAKVFPDACYIVLVRDFRDNILSRKKYAESRSSIFGLALAWNFYYQQIFKKIKQHNLRYKVVKYEDLVANSEQELKGLCSFINVPYVPEMLNFQELSKKMKQHAKLNASDVVYNKISKMHSNIDAEVNQNRVKAYEKELNDSEISILNYLCAEYGKFFGYLPKDASEKVFLSWRLKKIFYKLVIRVFHLYRSLYYSIPVSWRVQFLKKKT